MTEGQNRLESARAAVSRVYMDSVTPPGEIAESLELVIQDCEMYLDSIERRIAQDAEEPDEEPQDAEGWNE